ncbi:hypothetical protein [Blastococcus sp. CCUG 61487]|uniref:hypothetical protein n=1 Tax=Blastococcus sp. CCUG 61487 TaxID=1840703 RepID=UPI0010C020BD|nr:hypothetical protein [Blastococcus sp. CCUG 61487]TKJ35161.1 hypothetical protein A6V29_14435 [Blastococcus sp. CCUG 61487]
MTARRTLAALLLPLPLVLAGCAGTEASESGATSTPERSSDSTSPDSTSTDRGSAETSAPAPSSAATAFEVQVTGGQPTGDTGRVLVPLGNRVTVTITSDAPDEAHLHGYDVLVDLEPGTPAELAFDATVPGVFELELHDAGTVLQTLQVG